MNRLLTFLHPVLRALDDGNSIRAVASQVLRALAVVTALVGLLALIQVVKVSFQFGSTAATLGGLLLAAMLVAATLAVVQAMLYRAQTIHLLGRSTFTVIPIVSVLFRLSGEVYAIVGLSLSVGACVFTWLVGFSPRDLIGGLSLFLPIPSAGGTFVSGLLVLAVGAGVSILVLVVSYFMAESSLVLVDIAGNIQRLSSLPRAASSTEGSSLTCPNCGAPNPGATKGEFCSECGKQL